MIRLPAVAVGCMALILVGLGSARAQETVVGHVAALTGTATAGRGGSAVVLERGSEIVQGDVVRTAASSSLAITFVDGTALSLGPQASMTIDEMVYSAGTDANTALFSLTQGLFVLLSGDAAKSGNMRLATPVATIGIRGTTVAIRAGPEGSENMVSLLRDPDRHVGIVSVADQHAATMLTQLGATARLSHGSDATIATSRLTAQEIADTYGAALAAMQGLTGSDLGAARAHARGAALDSSRSASAGGSNGGLGGSVGAGDSGSAGGGSSAAGAGGGGSNGGGGSTGGGGGGSTGGGGGGSTGGGGTGDGNGTGGAGNGSQNPGQGGSHGNAGNGNAGNGHGHGNKGG